MQKEVALACIIGPIFLVYGLSLLLYAKQWKKVIMEFEKNHFALLPIAFMTLTMGVILVNVYNVWEWNLFLIITLTGWVLLIKSIFYFLAPGSWIRAILKWKESHYKWCHYFWGVVLVTLGALLSYVSYLNK